MDFRKYARLRFGSAIGWRSLAAICLSAASVEAMQSHRYLVAFVAAAALALTLFDLFLTSRRGPLDGTEVYSVAPDPERRLEAALALLDAVTVALFVIDADDRVRFVNRAGRRLAGFEIGRLDDIPGLDAAGVAGILALRAGGRQLLTLSDGRTMLVWVGSLSTPEDGARRLVSVQAVAGELDAVQVAAWHMMTRVLAHEMMNSLTPVVSLADSLASMLATAAPDPRIRDAVETIARRSRHLMDFVERYRAVVDLPEPQFADIDLDAMLAGIERLKTAELAQLGIAFSVAREGLIATVSGDQPLLEQALLNLVKNAAEAVGGVPNPRIELTCREARDQLVFSVIDNGTGIDDGLLEAVFVPFYTTKAGGAGIGLTFARQVALAHGGRLSVRRLESGGVALELTLPTARAGAGLWHLAGTPPGIRRR